MSYVLGWGLVLGIAGVVALVLRKIGPPGMDGSVRRSPGHGCCNAPPQPPPDASARSQRPTR